MMIAILPGDGIGKEVTAQAVKVLRCALGESCKYDLQEALIGSDAWEATGDTLPAETLKLAREADAILFGAMGLHDYNQGVRGPRPGGTLLRLRKELGLFANLRPVVMFPELVGASTLKPEVVKDLDIIIVRELSGDIYYGQPRGITENEFGERIGFNTMRYSESEVERIGHTAFKAARRRRKSVCSVDKANVLETSILWREVMSRVRFDYPDVVLSHLYVDAAAMELMRNPKQFDVIVTANLFGDILSDEAAMLAGSIGMLPSASFSDERKGLYEPVHGAAPEIAGRNIANPLASILCAAMMLRHSFDLDEPADRIEDAVRSVLQQGLRTGDIFEPGTKRVGTQEMGDAVVAAMSPYGSSRAKDCAKQVKSKTLYSTGGGANA
jgi:3-isopropylmalate dehydrogenase